MVSFDSSLRALTENVAPKTTRLYFDMSNFCLVIYEGSHKKYEQAFVRSSCRLVFFSFSVTDALVQSCKRAGQSCIRAARI